MLKFYDKEGTEVNLMEWVAMIEDDEYRVLASHWVGKVNVSTVWLGLDLGVPIYPERVPVIFETMVFGGVYDGHQERYPTKESALEGHVAMVAKVRHPSMRST